eukprot:4574529-Pyramimonas_sp.AAC.1
MSQVRLGRYGANGCKMLNSLSVTFSKLTRRSVLCHQTDNAGRTGSPWRFLRRRALVKRRPSGASLVAPLAPTKPNERTEKN